MQAGLVGSATRGRGIGRWLPAMRAALCALGCVACSGSSPAGPSGDDPPDTASTTTRTVDSGGGAVALSDGTRLVFPAGAVSDLVQVTLTRVNPADFFDAQEGVQQVVLSATASASQFAQPVEIMIPLSPGMTEADSADVLAGLIDPSSGAVRVVSSSVRMVDGAPFLVIPTTRFSSWMGWWWTAGGPPPSAGPIVIPYYNQGASQYCWAVSLQMVMQGAQFRRNTPVNQIIGRVGVDEGGITALAWRTSSTIRDLVAGHTGSRPDRQQWDFVNIDLARDYIRREIGLHGRPVAVHNTALGGGHAVVVVGYDGNTFFVHDPASTTFDAVGYTPMTWSQLGVGGVGHNLTTLTIPVPVTAGPSPLTLNVAARTIAFLKPAQGPQDPHSAQYSYRWDYTASEGYSFGAEGEPEAQDPLPGTVTELRFAPSAGIEIANASRTEQKTATVLVHLVAADAPDRVGHFSWSQNVTLAPNSVHTVSHTAVPVDTFRYNTSSPATYYYSISLLAGDEVVDRQLIEFRIEAITPVLTEAIPSTAAVGSVVALRGRRFGIFPLNSQVLFNGVPATDIESWQDDQIRVRVPEGADTGPVVVKRGEMASNEVMFTRTDEVTLTGSLVPRLLRRSASFPTYTVTCEGGWAFTGTDALIDYDEGEGFTRIRTRWGMPSRLTITPVTNFSPTAELENNQLVDYTDVKVTVRLSSSGTSPVVEMDEASEWDRRFEFTLANKFGYLEVSVAIVLEYSYGGRSYSHTSNVWRFQIQATDYP